jgi:flagellar basal body-associated protein FliL
MAVPQRQAQNVPLKDVADGELAKQSGGRMKFGVAWVWLLVVLFFVALIWFFAFGWGGNKQQIHRSSQLQQPSQTWHVNATVTPSLQLREI